jgi:lysozyme family protein
MIARLRALIDRVIVREGGAARTNDLDDSGGVTWYGLTRKDNPDAFADGVVTADEAHRIYLKRYVLSERFHLIEDDWLRDQVVDFGVTSGADRAARLLQAVLKVPVDGAIGPTTLKAIADYPKGFVCGYPVPGRVRLTLDFARARGRFYVTLTQKRPKDLKYLRGWLVRMLNALELVVTPNESE